MTGLALVERSWWNVHERIDWPEGPWDDEPDKVQFADAETGYPCLIVRGILGNLCGYVGVPSSHPWYGLVYGECVRGCTDEYCGHCPDNLTDVHGGLTFSGYCADTSHDAWERYREVFARSGEEAQRYPNGDAARRLREWGPVVDCYERWRARMEACAICHIPVKNEPDEVWWFGFDCAHLGDWVPGLTRFRSSFGMDPEEDDFYCTVDYVRNQIEALARQLRFVDWAMPERKRRWWNAE